MIVWYSLIIRKTTAVFNFYKVNGHNVKLLVEEKYDKSNVATGLSPSEVFIECISKYVKTILIFADNKVFLEISGRCTNKNHLQIYSVCNWLKQIFRWIIQMSPFLFAIKHRFLQFTVN